jgi:hypothetical protein
MNKPLPLPLATIAALVAGGGLIATANQSFTAHLPVEFILSLGSSLGLLGLAFQDYSRRLPVLTTPATVIRPSLPAAAPLRSAAYGVRRIERQRTAA